MKLLLCALVLLVSGCAMTKPLLQPYCIELPQTSRDTPCMGWLDERTNELSAVWSERFNRQVMIFVDHHGDILAFKVGY